MANAVCSQYRDENLVCPPILQNNIFTVAAADNIDHNLSSTTAQTSYHGTAISLMQFPVFGNFIAAPMSLNEASGASSDIILPLSYTDIQPCILPSSPALIPLADFTINVNDNITDDEFAWLDAVKASIMGSLIGCSLSWAAFHAEQDSRSMPLNAISALLPLFQHAANTPAMMQHSMMVIKAAVKKLNPSQTPVITVDQPLYALMKQLQWHWPEKLGEDKFVILLGGLHTEMAALRMLGHWLNGSGWTQCLVQAGVATAGVAESLITASHVKRSRYAHTVTAAALYCNIAECYKRYCEECEDGSSSSFGQWRDDMEKSSVQFLYWSSVLELELLVLSFVRSLRTSNFNLYVDYLQKLAPCFFAFDHTNYARWLPVHIRDMLTLGKTHPDVYNEFVAGKFTISKSGHKFSNIAIDQAHEQLNASIKGDGGAVGLTENDSALCQWTITGPEIVKLLTEFESDLFDTAGDTKHHEQTVSMQNKFRGDVEKMLEIFESEVPFSTTTCNELIVLTTHTIADKSVAETVRKFKEIGNAQFINLVDERLRSQAVSVLSPIHRNKLPLFPYESSRKKISSSNLKLSELKTD